MYGEAEYRETTPVRASQETRSKPKPQRLLVFIYPAKGYITSILNGVAANPTFWKFQSSLIIHPDLADEIGTTSGEPTY